MPAVVMLKDAGRRKKKDCKEIGMVVRKQEIAGEEPGFVLGGEDPEEARVNEIAVKTSLISPKPRVKALFM